MSSTFPLRFFKIVLDMESPTLSLPKKFIAKLKALSRNLPGTTKFCVPTGEEFDVQLIKMADGHYFAKGWPEFREKFKMERGYLLLFAYDGHKKWDVSIFDLTTVTIDYESFMTPAQVNVKVEVQDEVQSTDDERYGDEDAALCAANAYVENLPIGATYFVKKMVKSFLTGDCVLNVPKDKVQKALRGSRRRLMTLHVVDGGDVDCKLSIASGRARLTCGWNKVVKNEGLKEGDQVVFTVGHIDPTVWDVIVFRV